MELTEKPTLYLERKEKEKKRHALILIVLFSKGITFRFPQISYLCHCLSLGWHQSRPCNKYLGRMLYLDMTAKSKVRDLVSQRKKEGKWIKDVFISGLVLWATGGQPSWSLLRDSIEFGWAVSLGSEESGVFLHQVPLLMVEGPSWSNCLAFPAWPTQRPSTLPRSESDHGQRNWGYQGIWEPSAFTLQVWQRGSRWDIDSIW